MGTGSYKDWNSLSYLTYSISGDCGKDAGYKGLCYSKLAPKKSFWEVWHNNIGKISDEENNRYYVEEYYNQVLSQLDPEEIYEKLKYAVLLCYEDNNEFCHRHIVAEWFQLLLDKCVPELKIEDNVIITVDRPSYIRTYLEDAIKKNKDTKGFQSLRALYLFEKSEELKQKADELEAKGVVGFCEKYRQKAFCLRSDANEIESKISMAMNDKKRSKKLI